MDRWAVLVVCASAFGQSAAPAVAFEAASLKPTENRASYPTGAMRGGPGTDDPGQIAWLNLRLWRIVASAYERESFNVSAPDWMNNERYDIVARVPPNTTRPQMLEMVQNLLVERLALKVHREMRNLPAYDLTLLSGGLKMKESPPDGGTAGSESPVPLKLVKGADGPWELPEGATGIMPIPATPRLTRLCARRQTMPEIVHSFQGIVDAPITDKTGLTGKYNFNLDYANERSLSARPPDGTRTIDEVPPDFPTALQQQLRMKLAKRIEPQELVVVDSAEKVPVR